MTSKEIKEKLQDAERKLQEAKIVAYNWKKLKYLC